MKKAFLLFCSVFVSVCGTLGFSACKGSGENVSENSFEVLTKNEWEEAFSNTLNTQNFTYTKEQIVRKETERSDGVITVYQDGGKYFMKGACDPSQEKDCYSYFDNDKIYHYVKEGNDVWRREEVEMLMHVPELSLTFAPFAELYESFSFQQEEAGKEGIFIAESVDVMGINMYAEVKISNGYVTFLKYKMPGGSSDGIQLWYTVVFALYDFGATTVNLPNIEE